MKILKWSVVGILAVAGLLALVGWSLPSSFRVERAVDIRASSDKVYALVADPRQWVHWSEWNARDPRMKLSFSGAASGAGAIWSWESASEGNGRMEFTHAEPGRRIDYRLSFPDMGMTSSGALVLTESGAGTRLVWSNAGDMGANPFLRYFALFMDRLVGPDFESGLARLKALAER